MARREHDPEAHRKAAEKITFEKELCEDLINKHLSKVPEDKRADVRNALNALMIALRNSWYLWQPNFSYEWKRDRRALLRLIAAAFDRWEKADFVRPLVLHQLATNPKNAPKNMTSYLDEKGIGASQAAKTKTLQQVEAQRSADRQELSRGSRAFRAPKEKPNL